MYRQVLAAAIAASLAGPLAEADPRAAPSIQEPAHPGGITATDIDNAAAEQLRRLDAVALTDRDLYTATGEDMGEVEMVVVDRERRDAYVIAEVGGFLGIGKEIIVVPLRDLELRDGNLVLTSDVTAEQMAERYAFEANRFLRIPKYRNIASVLEGAPPSVSFVELDRDNDGYLTREEAAGWGLVIDEWSRIDTDQDDRLSEAEFSAFE